MPANFTKPVTSDLRDAVLQYIREYETAQAKMFAGETLTGTPTDAIRYNPSTTQFEKWNGATWAALALGFLPLAGGTMTGTLTGAGGTFTSLSVGGNTVWHAGNDGAASGLDADLLDGQQGSYYLAASTYTAADVLAKLLTVDGAASNLDADLLDGQEGAYYRDATNMNAGTFANARISLANVSQHQLSLSIDAANLSQGSIPNARVAVGNVTQHQASLSIAESQIVDGALLARLGSAETVSGLWNFTTNPTLGGKKIGYLGIPASTTSGTLVATDNGKCVRLSAGATVPASVFAEDDCVSLWNSTAAAVTITRGAGLVLWRNGVDVASFSLNPRTFATIWFNSATEAGVA